MTRVVPIDRLQHHVLTALLVLLVLSLACISHQPSAAAPQEHDLTDFPSVGVLDVLSSTPARSSVGKNHHVAPLRRLATNAGEKRRLAVAAQARDPRNKAECVQMTKGLLETQCRTLFAAPAQRGEQSACLDAVGPQLEAVCEQFFGEGRDFCATCTSSCTQAFTSGDPKRRDCLQMCLRQPGCQ